MTLRKPLVCVNGQIQQIQSGDTLDITGEGSVTLTNNEATSLVICTPVYIDAADGVKKAKADASGTMKVFGLVKSASIEASASGEIQVENVLTATTEQWDTVAGTTGGLTAGTTYYLSATIAGEITATAPTTTAQYVVPVGVAISTTELKINISAFGGILL
jgi:predicted RecA/RadA family phage recombinase